MEHARPEFSIGELDNPMASNSARSATDDVFEPDVELSAERDTSGIGEEPRRPVLQLNGVALNAKEQKSLAAVILDVFNRQFSAAEGGVESDLTTSSSDDSPAAAAQLQANASLMVSLIRGTVASIGEAPLSFHQATMYFCLQNEYSPAWKAIWVGVSYLMVVAQCLSALTLLLATFTNSCRNNKGCNSVEGQFCRPSNMRCSYCGDQWLDATDVGRPTLTSNGDLGERSGAQQLRDLDLEDLSILNATDFCIEHTAADPLRPMTNAEAMCVFDQYEDLNGCRHLNNPDLWMPNADAAHCIEIVVAMHLSDWIVLAFCSTLVALTMCNELRDMKLAQIAMAKIQLNSDVRSAWRFPLDGLNTLRQYTMLPTVVFSVTAIILHMGGDAISVCFNTVRDPRPTSPARKRRDLLDRIFKALTGWVMQVAVLFLLEMDVSYRTFLLLLNDLSHCRHK
jgi:hypothetical protein